MDLLQIDEIKEFIEAKGKHFNHFKESIDRAYFLYSLFRYHQRGKLGYIIEKMQGSNQVLFYKDGEKIYDRFDETFNQNKPKRFKLWIYEVIRDYIKRRDKFFGG